MKYKKVKGEPNLVRDLKNGAIINSNSGAYMAAKNRKKIGDRVEKIEERINSLESSLEDINSNLEKIIIIINR